MKTLLLLFLCLFTSSVFSQHYFLFIGTYTSGKSKGIYVYDFNAANGQLKWISNTDSSANPSFLTIAPDGKHVYAVNEISRQQAGLVVAYDFNPQTGKLQSIATTPFLSQCNQVCIHSFLRVAFSCTLVSNTLCMMKTQFLIDPQ